VGVAPSVLISNLEMKNNLAMENELAIENPKP